MVNSLTTPMLTTDGFLRTRAETSTCVNGKLVTSSLVHFYHEHLTPPRLAIWSASTAVVEQAEVALCGAVHAAWRALFSPFSTERCKRSRQWLLWRNREGTFFPWIHDILFLGKSVSVVTIILWGGRTCLVICPSSRTQLIIGWSFCI